jgi:hypothetical protein
VNYLIDTNIISEVRTFRALGQFASLLDPRIGKRLHAFRRPRNVGGEKTQERSHDRIGLSLGRRLARDGDKHGSRPDDVSMDLALLPEFRMRFKQCLFQADGLGLAGVRDGASVRAHPKPFHTYINTYQSLFQCPRVVASRGVASRIWRSRRCASVRRPRRPGLARVAPQSGRIRRLSVFPLPFAQPYTGATTAVLIDEHNTGGFQGAANGQVIGRP